MFEILLAIGLIFTPAHSIGAVVDDRGNSRGVAAAECPRNARDCFPEDRVGLLLMVAGFWV